MYKDKSKWVSFVLIVVIGLKTSAYAAIPSGLTDFQRKAWKALADNGYPKDYLRKNIKYISSAEGAKAVRLIAPAKGPINLGDFAKIGSVHLPLLEAMIKRDAKWGTVETIQQVSLITDKRLIELLTELGSVYGYPLSGPSGYLDPSSPNGISKLKTDESIAAARLVARNTSQGLLISKLTLAKPFHLPYLEELLIKNREWGKPEYIQQFFDHLETEAHADTFLRLIRANESFETALDQVKVVRNAYSELSHLIGLREVKEEVEKIIKLARANQIRRKLGLPELEVSHHFVFAGSPGTGKTTVARLLAKVYQGLGVLSKGHFVEVSKVDLVGQHLGQTQPKVQAKVEEAKGGVLFIDEAYSLNEGKSEHDLYGQEAVATLIQEMENNRKDLVVILAGYVDEMRQFLNTNPGLRSRFNTYINFTDYENSELHQIMMKLFKEKGFEIESLAEETLEKYFKNFRRTKNFGNARYVRNLVDEVIKRQASRVSTDLDPQACASLSKEKKGELREKLTLIKADDVSFLAAGTQEQMIQEPLLAEALGELDQLDGLEKIKEEIHDLVALIKINNFKKRAGIAVDDLTHHLVFMGSPGTGKTSVARIIGKIYRALNVVSRGHFLEVGRSDLVASYLGQTSAKVKDRIETATGGVLFIDEAYSLCGNSLDQFGQEAVDTLVQEIENNRDLVVILAGYTEKMQEFFQKNQGLRSRFNLHLNFDDYKNAELEEIMKKMIAKRGLKLTNDAAALVKYYFQSFTRPEDFGNARFVRNLVDEIMKKQARRLSNLRAEDLEAEGRERRIEILTEITREDVATVMRL